MRAASLILATSLAAALGAGAARAETRLVSYDPANDVTRRVAGAWTFEIDQHLVFARVVRVRSTEGEAAADLKPAGDGVLGHGGLSGLIGTKADERDLYEIKPTDEGADMIRAFCPGSERAWLAFGRFSPGQDLKVRVIGDAPGQKRTRLCQTLAFTYHGEWTRPAGQPVRVEDVKTPHFPY